MTTQLFLLLQADTPALHWVLYREGTQVPEQGQSESLQTLIAARPELARMAATVIVPGEQVLTLSVEIPPKWSKKLLNWAVEEQITSTPEEVHICPLDRRSPDGMLTVAVVDRPQMSRWQKQLQDSGVQVTAMIPDYLGLSEQSFLEGNERVLLRSGPATGIALPTGWLPDWLTLNSIEKESLHAVQSGSEPDTTLLALTSQLKEQTLTPTLNLLQDDFRLARPGGRLKSFVPALSMVAAALVIQIGLFTWDSVQLVNQKQQLDQEISQLFKSAMGKNGRMIRPVHQMKSRIATLETGSETSFLRRLERLTQVWPNKGVMLSGIETEGEQLRVIVEVENNVWPDFEQALAGYSPVTISDVSALPGNSKAQQVQLEVTQ